MRARGPASAGDQVVIYSLLDAGRRALGIECAIGSMYHRRLVTAIRRRFSEGATKEQLLMVAQWARTERDSGNKFAQYQNLCYLWGSTFPALLSAAQTPVGNSLVFRHGDARADLDRRAKAAMTEGISR